MATIWLHGVKPVTFEELGSTWKGAYYPNDDVSSYMHHLMALQKEGKLFEDGSVDFVIPFIGGWHIPIIGVREIFYLNNIGDKAVRLTGEGVDERELPYSNYKDIERRFLKPHYQDVDGELKIMLRPPYLDWFNSLEKEKSGNTN